MMDGAQKDNFLCTGINSCWVRQKVLSREWKLELEQQQIDWQIFPWSSGLTPGSPCQFKAPDPCR